MFEQRQLVELIRGRLAQRKPAISDVIGVRRAAVLAPLLFKPDGEPHLLFTQRTQDVPTHKGQVSFPGGGVEAYDTDECMAALRETSEEVGVLPNDVDVLGRMDELLTFSSTFIITPFAAVIPDGVAHVTSDREVARILEVPLKHLLDPNLRQPDQATHHWRYTWNGTVIWGATARILNEFLTILGLVDPFAEDLAIVRALADPEDKLRFTNLMSALHPDRKSAADYVRQSCKGATSPAIAAAVGQAGVPAQALNEPDGSWQAQRPAVLP